MKKFSKFISLILTLAIVLSALAVPVATSAYTEFEQSLIDAGFPLSYIPGLSALHDAHPAWVFTPYRTGIEWSALFTTSAEMAASRNLEVLTTSGAKKSWFACDSQYYNPQTNTYTTYDSGIWAQVSEDLLAYYMDPRNFFTDKGMFQFEYLGYNSNIQNVNGVTPIIKNSFMVQRNLKDASGNTYTYAEAFIAAAQASGASPYYLASKVLNEQGTGGTSPLISGNAGSAIWAEYQTDVAAGKISPIAGASEAYFQQNYNGYYNYFNMGASGNGKANIYINGLNEAKKEGWNSEYAALVGGAVKAANSYIAKGQDTYYLQKFNVTDGTKNCWRQYMQAVQGSIALAKGSYPAYVSTNSLENAFVFSIPVYNNMPLSCPLPSADNVANTLLTNVVINGTAVPGFKPYNIEFNHSVNGTLSSVTIGVTALYNAASISLGGKTSTGTASATVTLSGKDRTVIPVTVTSPHGTTTYNITILSNIYELTADIVNGKVHFGNPGMATTHYYMPEVDAGRSCGVFFAPELGYAISSITRSDGVAVTDFSRVYGGPISQGFEMPQRKLTFTANCVPIFDASDSFKVIVAGNVPYLTGCKSYGTVSALKAAIKAQAVMGSNADITVYSNVAPNTVIADNAAFVEGMPVEIDEVVYYTSLSNDVDGDEDITVSDVSCAYQILMTKGSYTTAQKVAADVDKDGRVTILDVVALLNIVSGNN